MDNTKVKVNLKRRPYRGVLLVIAQRLNISTLVARKRWYRNEPEVTTLVLRELIKRDEKEKKSSRVLRELLAQLDSNVR